MPATRGSRKREAETLPSVQEKENIDVNPISVKAEPKKKAKKSTALIASIPELSSPFAPVDVSTPVTRKSKRSSRVKTPLMSTPSFSEALNSSDFSTPQKSAKKSTKTATATTTPAVTPYAPPAMTEDEKQATEVYFKTAETKKPAKKAKTKADKKAEAELEERNRLELEAQKRFFDELSETEELVVESVADHEKKMGTRAYEAIAQVGLEPLEYDVFLKHMNEEVTV